MNDFLKRQKLSSMTKKNRLFLVSIVVVLIVTMIWSGLSASAASVVADESTLTKWSDTTGQDTKNIGRIWTDKSVSTESVKLPGGNEPAVEIGDSDFLVALSALSSAGKLTGEVTSVKPLDIVLVLDTSGSMDDTLGYIYEEVYDDGYSINRWGTYYAKTGTGNTADDYTRIRWEGNRNGHWELNGQEVEPKTSAEDNSSNRIQFYTIGDVVTNMEALQSAANSFIDSTAKENESISDESKKHKISLITYSSSANTRQELTVCDNENAATLKRTINRLNAEGGTHPEEAFANTEEVLKNARTDAQKVVIFFTDGGPGGTTSDPFDPEVANETIASAKTLKTANTKIYSVGVFGDADTSVTNDEFNAYMHGVSSNYPNATTYENLGERAKDAEGKPTEYYKAAGNADDLSKIFEDIFTEINTIDPTSPVEEGIGGTENMNAITFHDELGDYMKVDDFKAIVFADKVFRDPTVLTNPIESEDKEIIQYTFEGTADTGNTVYPKGDLNEIIITVERYNDPAKGDVVTVTIPASMIPLREYVVDTREGHKSMSIDETYPLRIFYGASLKDGVEDNLADPDETLQDYIDANKDDQGQINFYSNKYYADGTNNGGVYVEYQPNKTNDFYYFQEDEILYTGTAPTEAGGEPGNKQIATGTLDTSGDTIYYYDRLYYSLENDQPVEKHNWVQIPGNSNLPLSGFVKNNADDELYIPMGTPRTTSLETHALNKTEASNKTGTAPYVTAPNWDNLETPVNVIVKLGNNGLLKVDLPGTLEVSKTVNPVNGTPDENAEFTFDITLTGDNVKDSYTAQKFNAAGTAEGEAATIAFTDGKGQITLKDGEKVQLYGLAKGTEYTVTEQEVADDGFTLTKTENGTGTIAAGAISAAKFTNDYSVGELKIQAEDFGLKGTKYITGENRQFETGDIFKFDITASDVAPHSPVPKTGASAIIEPTSGTEAEINFGEFVFDKAGHYRYSIKEYLPTGSGSENYNKIIPGITYDTTNYRLILTVVDNGNGELVATDVHIDKNSGEAGDVEWTPVYPADGANGAGLPEGNPEYLKFTNTYVANEQTVSLVARKEMNKLLTDYSMKEQFGFVVEAGGSRVAGTDDAFAENSKQPMPTDTDGKYIYRNDTTGVITIPHIVFTPDNAPDDGSKVEYLYKIRELQPTDNGKFEGNGIEGATKVDGKWTYKGVTFDNEVKEVKVTAWSESKEVDEVTTHVVNVQIDYGNSNNQHTFVNEYNASTATSITGTKEITGRIFNANDEFTFNIAARDGAPLPVDANGNELNSVTINPNSGSKATINFGTFKFDQDDILGEDGQATGATKTVDSNEHASYEKTFKYTITEANLGADGIAYDTAPRELSITVKDDGYGNMTVEESVLSDSTWTNVYTASMTLSDGIEISKTLTGKAMNVGEFTFTITPEGDAPALGDSDKRFTNTTWTAAGKANVMKKLTSLKFTEADAGKEYTYVIDEVEGNAGGITYDKSQYKVVIAVTDNGDGTMTAVTKFYQIMDEDGNVVTDTDNPEAPGLEVDAIAFNNSYAAGPGTLSGAANLMVTKEFTGRANDEWLDTDSFTFNLELTGKPDGFVTTDVEIPNPTTVTIDKNDKANGYKDSFGDITFNKVGTYVFTISEVTDGLSDKGITCNTEPRTVTIVVSDPGTGTLVPTKAASSHALHFRNEYKAGAVGFAGINVEKTLSGRDWKESDSFEFILEGNDEDTNTAIEAGYVKLPNPAEIEIDGTDADKKEAFKAITFTKAGNYSFKVTEVAPENAENKIAGISYDTTAKVVNIEVTDGTAGKLVAKVVNDDGSKSDSTTVTFANTYTPADADPVTTTGLFTKAIEGRNWIADDEFKFTITPQDGAPVPKNNEVTVSSDSAEDGTKVPFDFGTITFTADHMKDADGNRVMSKEFKYTVTEENAGETINGLTYANNTATMTITVTDDGTGKLSAAKAVANGDFVNTYSTSLSYDARINLYISKTLNGRDLEKDQFEFTVKPVDEKTAAKLGIPESVNDKGDPSGEKEIVVKSNAAEMGQTVQMAVPFNSAEDFTQKDVGETYSYTIEETKKGDTGYINDTEIAQVDITTADDGKGKLTVTTKLTKGDKTSTVVVTTDDTQPQSLVVPFVNSYNEEPAILGEGGEIAIEANKSLTGRGLVKDEFEFEVKDVKGNVVATGTNDAAGNITFTDIKYDMAKLEADVDNKIATVDRAFEYPKYIYTYQYTVSEKTEGLADKGITASTPSMNITVTVTDNAEGSLNIVVAYPDGKDKLEFKNQYGLDSASVNIAGQKVYTILSGDKAPNIVGEYTFTLSGEDGAPMPNKTTTTNDKNGDIVFGDIKYTMDNVNFDTTNNDGTREKVFTYKIKEEGVITGVANDTEQTFKVKVVDDGDGHIAAETIGASGALFRFDNKYSVTPIKGNLTGTIKITKDLEGRDLQAGEFKFELVERISEGDNVVDKVIDTATNDKDGNITFKEIEYTNVGVHEYLVREVNNNLGGVSYDTNIYKVVANVTDNGDGTLAVEYKQVVTSGEGLEIEFKNTYSANSTSVILGATKILKNGELKDGQFTFVLKDSEGNVVSEATNDEKGGIKFDKIDFDKEGTYEYTVSEVKGTDENIKYDDKEFNITIEVKDDLKGNLNAEVTNDGEMTFVNVMEEQKVEEPDEPKTGDDTAVGLLAGLLAAATAGIALLRKKKSDK